MISVTEALTLIESNTSLLDPVKIPIFDAIGGILSTPVHASIDMPPFRQSAMDGYAIIHSDQSTRLLVGEIKAGDAQNLSMRREDAVRVFTGAPIPENADTVVIQEHVVVKDNELYIEDLPPQNANVRERGEQVKKGELVLASGTPVNEATIGFLAGMGIEEITVYRRPRVSILTTGNELQALGNPLEPGKIYESNGLMLKACLKRLGIEQVEVHKVADNFEDTKKTIANAFKEADVLLVSGGISVGDYDFVREALQANGVEELFYKVNQKPGKPIWFGKKSDLTVFALPGNPASSLTCFYVYVVPALRKMMGKETIYLEQKTAILSQSLENNAGKTLFLKASVENYSIRPLTGQASSMLNTYAISNALLIVPNDQKKLNEGDEVSYLDLNF